MSTAAQSRTLHVACFIDSMDPGGAEEVVLALAAGLPAHGLRVTVMHFGNPWIAAEAHARRIEQHVLDARHYKSTLTLPLFVRSFATTLRVLRIDIVHSHLLGAIFAGAFSARLAGIPSIGTIHDIYSLHESRWNPRYLRWAQRAGCRLVAVCDAMLDEVQRVCRIRGVDRIYNGVVMSRLPARTRPADEAVVRIICVARAVPVKRHDLLIRAFASMRCGLPVELHIVGDGPLLPRLRQLAVDAGVPDRVIFHGHRGDVPKLLADSDIYALVSDSEGMSVSVLESMAAGLPAVVTDVGGNRELVADGGSGRVVARGDETAVAGALRQLVDDASSRSQFGAQARRRVAELFTVQLMCARYAILLRERANHD